MYDFLPVLLLVFVIYIGYEIFIKNNITNKINKKNLTSSAMHDELIEFIKSITQKSYSSDLFLKRNEKLIISFKKIYLLKNKKIKTEGGYEGLSINVASGVNYRVGQFAAKTKIKLSKVDEGELFLTNKRILFIGETGSDSIDLSKIVSIKTLVDGIVIYHINNDIVGLMNIDQSWSNLISLANNNVSDDIKSYPESNFKKLLSIYIKNITS